MHSIKEDKNYYVCCQIKKNCYKQYCKTNMILAIRYSFLKILNDTSRQKLDTRRKHLAKGAQVNVIIFNITVVQFITTHLNF